MTEAAASRAASGPSRAQLQTWIEQDPRLKCLFGLAAEQLAEDPGHDLEHSLRVAAWTLRCSAGELPRHEAIAAALLHDLVNVPKNSPERARASELCAAAAAPLLAQAGFSEPDSERVCDAIRTHSFSRGEPPSTPLGAALCDADRLEALGAIGLMRTLSTGTQMGARYVHPEDPWACQRPLDDKRYSVDHCFTKLLKLPGTMWTEVGRQEARRRAAFLECFLAQLEHELGVPRG